MTKVYLRKSQKHPDSAGYLQQYIQHNIKDANSYISDKIFALASRLLELELVRTSRPYAIFKICW